MYIIKKHNKNFFGIQSTFNCNFVIKQCAYHFFSVRFFPYLEKTHSNSDFVIETVFSHLYLCLQFPCLKTLLCHKALCTANCILVWLFAYLERIRQNPFCFCLVYRSLSQTQSGSTVFSKLYFSVVVCLPDRSLNLYIDPSLE